MKHSLHIEPQDTLNVPAQPFYLTHDALNKKTGKGKAEKHLNLNNFLHSHEGKWQNNGTGFSSRTAVRINQEILINHIIFFSKLKCQWLFGRKDSPTDRKTLFETISEQINKYQDIY